MIPPESIANDCCLFHLHWSCVSALTAFVIGASFLASLVHYLRPQEMDLRLLQDLCRRHSAA